MTEVAAPFRDDAGALLRVENLTVEFPVGRTQRVHAVSDVSFDIMPRESLGLVGETGSGKSSTAFAVAQLPPPRSGSVVFDGLNLTDLDRRALRVVRPRLQLIFQDPVSSLNPRRRLVDSVAEPLRTLGRPREARRRAAAMLAAVGMDPETAGSRRPSDFSGGQCQRASIARALVLQPDLLICDEPVSALDVSVQAQILNLLNDLRERYGLAMLFISHDLAVVRNVSDRVAVMYLGRLCEIGESDAVYTTPRHPYTAALLEAIPVPDPKARPRPAEVSAADAPSPINPPSGCRYRTRCPRADEVCAQEVPQLGRVGPDHYVACHHPLDTPVEMGTRRTAGVT